MQKQVRKTTMLYQSRICNTKSVKNEYSTVIVEINCPIPGLKHLPSPTSPVTSTSPSALVLIITTRLHSRIFLSACFHEFMSYPEAGDRIIYLSYRSEREHMRFLISNTVVLSLRKIKMVAFAWRIRKGFILSAGLTSVSSQVCLSQY